MDRLLAEQFLERLLAAHGAEDAFEPPEEPTGGPEATPTPAPPVDPSPVRGLLDEAEKLCGIDDVRLHAAAAA